MFFMVVIIGKEVFLKLDNFLNNNFCLIFKFIIKKNNVIKILLI